MRARRSRNGTRRPVVGSRYAGKSHDTTSGAGSSIDKQGIAPTLRFGIGTSDEFTVGFYYLENNNGINYGIPYLRRKIAAVAT